MCRRLCLKGFYSFFFRGLMFGGFVLVCIWLEVVVVLGGERVDFSWFGICMNMC